MTIDDARPVAQDAPSTRSGFGRVMVMVYAIFAVSATARATYQVIARFDDAPLSFALSGVAAALYIVATVALARSSAVSRRVAWVSVTIELVGVLGVGLVSFARPDLFPEPSVWSHLGQGYGYVPFVLPFVGLWWLARTRPARQSHA
ncbi:hypothetical protein ATL41_0124 [Flavimobilis soli]|uniref:Integral membrane protein n=1 Tax=Flavimobilis soli TaxID=442709 RepID=A0A2A9E9A9_9MICO|nr:hypothetical protein [Flavimobilis soli]PFG35444.1 hypothetical protein ATL41_0124 [Flavimobilis soli]